MAKQNDTKTKLVRVAIDLFAEEGLHRVSFQQIGNELGITQAALYKHFRDKDDLLLACATFCSLLKRERISSAMSQIENAAERLFLYIRANFEWQQLYRNEAALLASLSYFGLCNQAIGSFALEIQKEREASIVLLFKQGAQKGDWPLTRFEKKARIFDSLLEAELTKALLLAQEMTADQRANLVWLSFKSHLNISTQIGKLAAFGRQPLIT